jgi:hypothetical protein
VKNTLREFTLWTLAITVAIWTISSGGVLFDLLFKTQVAYAAYTGKQLKTIEYMLGCDSSTSACSDNTTRSSATVVYYGTSRSTTKSSAGTKSIVVEGSSIKVRSAYLELLTQATASTSTTNIALTLDVANGPNPGVDVRVTEELANTTWSTSGLTTQIRAVSDATALFQTQTDAQFNAGVATVASVAITGPSTRLGTLKLVITYESDYSTTAHTEVKTVRFPLNSTGTGDTGSRQAVCSASSTCSFAYLADIPDATQDSDILDVWFEITGEMDSSTASTITPQISGGTAGPAFAWIETISDDRYINVFLRPAVGGNDFQRNTAQTLDVVTGTVPLYTLGGELVVTYRYSTGASSQTETIRYFMDQRLSDPSTTKNTFSKSVAISNSGFSVKNLWFKAHTAPVNAVNIEVFGTVGGATEKSNVYAYNGANPRAGDTATIYYDMSADASSFSSSPTTVAGAVQFSAAGGAGPAVELYLTFTWSGSAGGTVTKTVQFSAAQQGGNTTASQWWNRPVYVALPETVTKTYRSSYLETNYHHSQSTSITIGTFTNGVNGDTAVYNEIADATSEAYLVTLFYEIPSAMFSGGSTISWNNRVFEINQTRNVANEASIWNIFIVTYDAALAAGEPPTGPATEELMRHGNFFSGGTEQYFFWVD